MLTGKDLEDMGYFEAFQTTEPIKLEDYAEWVENKMITTGDKRFLENTMGLIGETGEFFEKLKKHKRDDTPLDKQGVTLEAGDMFTQAQVFDANITIGALKRLRVYYINRAATGSNSHIKALMVRADSIG